MPRLQILFWLLILPLGGNCQVDKPYRIAEFRQELQTTICWFQSRRVRDSISQICPQSVALFDKIVVTYQGVDDQLAALNQDVDFWNGNWEIDWDPIMELRNDWLPIYTLSDNTYTDNPVDGVRTYTHPCYKVIKGFFSPLYTQRELKQPDFEDPNWLRCKVELSRRKTGSSNSEDSSISFADENNEGLENGEEPVLDSEEGAANETARYKEPLYPTDADNFFNKLELAKLNLRPYQSARNTSQESYSDYRPAITPQVRNAAAEFFNYSEDEDTGDDIYGMRRTAQNWAEKLVGVRDMLTRAKETFVEIINRRVISLVTDGLSPADDLKAIESLTETDPNDLDRRHAEVARNAALTGAFFHLFEFNKK